MNVTVHPPSQRRRRWFPPCQPPCATVLGFSGLALVRSWKWNCRRAFHPGNTRSILQLCIFYFNSFADQRSPYAGISNGPHPLTLYTHAMTTNVASHIRLMKQSILRRTVRFCMEAIAIFINSFHLFSCACNVYFILYMIFEKSLKIE